jgi:hypothetical protein
MAVEGDRASGQAEHARTIDHLVDQVLVAAVEAVETADGQDCREGRDHVAQLA